MTYLADTCALLAYLGGGGRTMTQAGHAAMRSGPFVSPITVWELTHKAQRGQLPPLPTLGGSVMRKLVSLGFQAERFESEDAEITGSLPPLHKDPMDRMLIGTARRAGYGVITCDAVFREYGVETVW